MHWNSERDNELRQLWEVDGLTAAAIANHFSVNGHAVTRNAVVGRTHRLELVMPPWKADELKRKQGERNRAKRQATAISDRRCAPRKAKPKPTFIKAPKGKSILLTEIRDDQCKAILGYKDGLPDKALYCGRQTVDTNRGDKKTSWCAYHKSIYHAEDKRK